MVLGFSFSGAVIPAGSGVLTVLEIDGDEACLSDLVLTDASAVTLDASIEDCLTISYTSPILGCTDEMACNYDSEANIDDGSCLSETCENGMCVSDMVYCPIFGCMDESACNYNEFAVYDDEINYNLWDETHPDGGLQYGHAIENLPLLEPFENTIYQLEKKNSIYINNINLLKEPERSHLKEKVCKIIKIYQNFSNLYQKNKSKNIIPLN